MKTLIRYFVQGLLITVPVGISLYVMYYIFSKVGALLMKTGVSVNPYVDPLIGVVAVVLVIIIIGMIGSTIVVQPLLLVMDRVAEKTPLFKTVYSSVKDLMSAFVGNKKKFNRPVMVLMDRQNNIQQLGFITQTELADLGVKDGKVAVYMPNSYAFSGTLIIVPEENVTPIDASSSETLKFIVSGGITDID
ncbi:MAG TPA: DUF502 domain-containing protein [Bacteroidia bacterium]